MVFDKIIAKKTINYLLQINAIKLNTKTPSLGLVGLNLQSTVIIDLFFQILKLEITSLIKWLI